MRRGSGETFSRMRKLSERGGDFPLCPILTIHEKIWSRTRFRPYNTGMSERSAGIFETLPASFFSPLASPNREHYAALLIIYYRTFQEFPNGVERSTLIARFGEYVTLHRAQIADDGDDDDGINETQKADPLNPELFGADETLSTESVRVESSRFLRNLTRCGWVSAEETENYTRMVNMTAWARPFLEALVKVDEGLVTEYESHIVAVYSLLTGDAARENGHYSVMNAHVSTVSLNDSLKVLLQNIKEHHERLTAIRETGKVGDLLHLHYDLYAGDVLDGAYKRLKTSDNLSRYRPRILRRIGELLADGEWLESSALKYAQTRRVPAGEGKQSLKTMLDEIRDILKGLDPLLEEIDRRNMQYARSSVERVRMLLEPDSSLAGRICLVAREIARSDSLWRDFSHHLYQARLVSPESRYRRWLREVIAAEAPSGAPVDQAALERAEAELRLRLARQLNPERITAWLDLSGGRDRLLEARSLVSDASSWVRLLYAVVYADSRSDRFDYLIEDGPGGRTAAAGYEIPDILFRRKK